METTYTQNQKHRNRKSNPARRNNEELSHSVLWVLNFVMLQISILIWSVILFRSDRTENAITLANDILCLFNVSSYFSPFDVLKIINLLGEWFKSRKTERTYLNRASVLTSGITCRRNPELLIYFSMLTASAYFMLGASSFAFGNRTTNFYYY